MRRATTRYFSARDTIASDAIGSELKRYIAVGLCERGLLPVILKAGQNASNQIDAGKAFVVGAHDVPWRYRCMSPKQHGVARLAIGLPMLHRNRINRARLPLLKRIILPSGEAENLLILADVQIVLQNFMPEFTSIASNVGTDCMNSSCSSVLQNPITGSTPARLYQLRLNNTNSCATGKKCT